MLAIKDAYPLDGETALQAIYDSGGVAARVTGEEDDGCTQQVICPILCEGDVIGGVMILGKDEKRKLGETELKLASCAAGFLGRQMEQ